MPGIVVAVVLGLSLLLVQRALRARPMRMEQPLDVDEGLPLPELAQTSTVFSLTALFGAYFGIAVALGLPALMGLAFGTSLGLFLVRYWIDYTLRRKEGGGAKTFEDFLSRILKGDETNTTVYALIISGVQCVYATCELLIFRELARAALGLKPEEATILVISVAIIGYFYVLRGGYIAVFRTDMVQLGLVGIMALVSSAVLFIRYSQVGWTNKLWPRPGFWELPFFGAGRWLYLYHFIIATVMALGLMVSSPDTWKRVFQVMQRKTGPVRLALTLLGVGTVPYLVLLPVAITVSLNVTFPIHEGAMRAPTLSGNYVLVVIALGLIASFLSSFNSAMLASVHVLLILQRNKEPVDSEELRFYRLMVSALFTICLLFVASFVMIGNEWLFRYHNPWLLGNLLMGAYALIAGIQIGTRGSVQRLPRRSVEWIFVIGMIVWFVYFVSSPGFSQKPTINSVNTVPAGVCLFFVTAIFSQLLSLGDRNYAKH